MATRTSDRFVGHGTKPFTGSSPLKPCGSKYISKYLLCGLTYIDRTYFGVGVPEKKAVTDDIDLADTETS